jgi:hypothetical protein
MKVSEAPRVSTNTVTIRVRVRAFGLTYLLRVLTLVRPLSLARWLCGAALRHWPVYVQVERGPWVRERLAWMGDTEPDGGRHA